MRIPLFPLVTPAGYFDRKDFFQEFLRAGKNKLFVAENGPFGTPFLTPKILLKKFMWVPFLSPFPRNEAPKLFSGGLKWGVLGRGAKGFC